MATRDRPILFSGEMVRAILDGRKTQTRRVIKPQPSETGAGAMGEQYFRWEHPRLDAGYCHTTRPAMERLMLSVCPYGAPGDRLWVRETWCHLDEDHRIGDVKCAYRASTTGDGDEIRREYVRLGRDYKWRPSIHMPRWASRLTLEVTDVRVERVQDISEADAEAEGVRGDGLGGNESMRVHFRWLWDKINASRGFGWDTNPWLWVVEFRRVEQ